MAFVHLFSYFFSEDEIWFFILSGSFNLVFYNPCFLFTSDFTWCMVWQIGTNILEESFLGYVAMEVGG
jgi:hypothetical protein